VIIQTRRRRARGEAVQKVGKHGSQQWCMDKVYCKAVLAQEAEIAVREDALCGVVEHDTKAYHLRANAWIEASLLSVARENDFAQCGHASCPSRPLWLVFWIRVEEETEYNECGG